MLATPWDIACAEALSRKLTRSGLVIACINSLVLFLGKAYVLTRLLPLRIHDGAEMDFQSLFFYLVSCRKTM